jgi:hypothetical protein
MVPPEHEQTAWTEHQTANLESNETKQINKQQKPNQLQNNVNVGTTVTVNANEINRP